MNSQLEQFARNTLKQQLNSLPDSWINTFKLMYGRKGGKRSVEDAKAMDIGAVVDEMPIDQLDWAMQQVSNSISKLAKTP